MLPLDAHHAVPAPSWEGLPVLEDRAVSEPRELRLDRPLARLDGRLLPGQELFGLHFEQVRMLLPKCVPLPPILLDWALGVLGPRL